MAERTFDYVIVGAGTAGCVVARRIADKSNHSVCVVEAGDWADERDWRIRMPAGVFKLFADSTQGKNPYDWQYSSIPQAHLNNRVVREPKGKAVGGSSVVNVMIHVRGNPQDFDRWANQEGCLGWSYKECLPYFKRSESYINSESIARDRSRSCEEVKDSKNDSAYRGSTGPLKVTSGEIVHERAGAHPFYPAFIQACVEKGFPFRADLNGPEQEGVGWYDLAVADGERQDEGTAFLMEVVKARRVTLLANTLATKILLEHTDDGQLRAVGVECCEGAAQGQPMRLLARREVVLCAGAINSPKLLMLSGIGDSIELSNLGIQVVQHLPGVGKNLQDHLALFMEYWTQDKPMVSVEGWEETHEKWACLFRSWNEQRSGILSGHQRFVVAFLKSKPEVLYPDLQYHPVATCTKISQGSLRFAEGAMLIVTALKPPTRGSIKLASKDPFQAPLINPNFLATQEELDALITCVEFGRSLFKHPVLDPFVGKEITPGAAAQSRDAIGEWAKRAATTAHHSCGTCKMGPPSDPMAVLDPQLRVRGVAGLSVADASVFPSITSGNTNAPVMMVAERAADFLI